MKRVYIAYQRFEKDGAPYTDADGCHYFKPHPVITGEWASPMAIMQAVQDHKNENPDNPITGELIIQEIITL